MSMIKNVVIFAAGMGKRLLPTTKFMNKTLLPVNGKPLVERTLDFLMESPLKSANFYLVVGHLAEDFEYLTKKYKIKLIKNNQFATANSISSLLASVEHVSETFFLESDFFWKYNIFPAINEQIQKHVGSLAFGSRMYKHARGIVFVLDDNKKIITTRQENDAFNQNVWAGCIYVDKEAGKEIQIKLPNYCIDKSHQNHFFKDFLWALDNKFTYCEIDPRSYVEIDKKDDLCLIEDYWEAQRCSKLFTPGPTNIPNSLLNKLTKGIIHSGSMLARHYIKELTDNLKWLFIGEQYLQSKSQIFLLSSSATGAMEAIVVNFISPEDKILLIKNGVFAERFCDIIKVFKLDKNLKKVTFDDNTPYDMDKILPLLEWADVVITTMHETSSGYLNPVNEIGKIVKNHPHKLFICDTVSAICFENINFDQNGIDVAIASSPKGFMCPVGLSIICASEKAMGKMNSVTTPRYYFDLRLYQDYAKRNSTPFTPTMMLIYTINESINQMREMGLNNLRKKQQKIYNYLNERLTSLGFKNFVKPNYQTASMLCMQAPKNINTSEMQMYIEIKYNYFFEIGRIDEPQRARNAKVRIGIPFSLEYDDAVNLANYIQEFLQLQSKNV